MKLIAFNANTLAKAKLLMPQFKMLWLLDLDYSKPEWLCFTNKNRLVRKVKRLKLDGVDVWAGKILNRPFISTFKKAGLLVYAWTVNNPKKAEMLINHGIDGITTDRAYAMNLQLKHIKN